MEDLSSIKKHRVALGLTQKGLSEASDVSQSMIAKIESGRAEASYGVARRIFEAIGSLAHASEPRVSDFMNRKVVSCRANERVRGVVSRMRKKGISQLPVLRSGQLVGSISEGVLLEIMDELSDLTDVGQIMRDAPPVVGENTSRGTVVSLLKEFPFVMVRGKKGFSGLVTKADILGQL